MMTVSSAAIGFIPLGQIEMFGTVVPSTSIVGLMVLLEERPCQLCGSLEATIGASAGPHCASLICAACSRHRGWLSAATYSFITNTVDTFGRTHEPITVRFKNSRNRADTPL